jgi:hypothetical protein
MLQFSEAIFRIHGRQDVTISHFACWNTVVSSLALLSVVVDCFQAI